MGQEEIYNFIKKKKEPVTFTILVKELGINKATISKGLKQMVKYGELEHLEVTINGKKIRAYITID